MRIGLNLLYLLPGRVGGSEVYARRLVSALATEHPHDEVVVFCGSEAAPSLTAEGWPPNVRVQRLAVRTAAKPLRMAAELTILPLAAARACVEVLHSLGTTSPLWAPCPSVVTIHDLIYEHFPQTFPAPALWGLKALVGPGARRADRVIAISEAVRSDVVQRLRIAPDRVDTIYNGYGRERHAAPTPAEVLRERMQLGGGRVVLCVSAALAHKNLPRLIEAFARLGSGLEDTRLVLVGHTGREHESLASLADRLGVGERVTLTGWVSDADLEGLYGLAACAVYPSLHEGFGLPVLEAMARDVPLACSTATSLPEVAGDAAELFDPLDPEAIATAVRRLLRDQQRASVLVARGRERVERFTWQRCARDVRTSYELALARHRT